MTVSAGVGTVQAQPFPRRGQYKVNSGSQNNPTNEQNNRLMRTLLMRHDDEIYLTVMTVRAGVGTVQASSWDTLCGLRAISDSSHIVYSASVPYGRCTVCAREHAWFCSGTAVAVALAWS